MDGIGKGAERLRFSATSGTRVRGRSWSTVLWASKPRDGHDAGSSRTGLDLSVGRGTGHPKAARDEPAKTQF